ncbi:MAG: diguanylate cyclase [Treponema sp.]|nr:diguanylate cyclase [Treponema sp.]
MGASFLAVILSSFVILIVSVNITRKNLITNNLNVRLQTIADIYESMYDIDLKTNTFSRITSSEFVDSVTKESSSDAQKALYNVMDKITEELGERKIYVSVGAYCHNGKKNLNFKDLYKLADQCTYTSKKKEGNAVTFYKK